MKSIETSIIIQSTPEAVWKVLMDFENYMKWNPFITAISGNAKSGETLEVEITIDQQKPVNMTPKVLEAQTNKVFCWEGHLFVKGLFDGKHRFEIIAQNNGTTELIQSEIFRGILVKPIMKLIGEKTIKGFNTMNEALKIRVESLIQLNKAS